MTSSSKSSRAPAHGAAPGRRLVDKRLFPAIDIFRSGTRREELLLSPNELNKMWVLRKVLGTMGVVEAMELLQEKDQGDEEQRRFLRA